MGDRNALQIATEAADIAEAQAREAEARKRKAFSDAQRKLVWAIVLVALFAGPGALTLAFKLIEVWLLGRIG